MSYIIWSLYTDPLLEYERVVIPDKQQTQTAHLNEQLWFEASPSQAFELAIATPKLPSKPHFKPTLDKLKVWVYEGKQSDKRKAIVYLQEFDIAALPLLLHLIFGENSSDITEAAIVQIAKIQPSILPSLYTHIGDNSHIRLFLDSLGVETPKADNSKYPFALQALANPHTQSIVDDFLNGAEDLKLGALARVSDINLQGTRQILNWVAVHDPSKLVRKTAIETGLLFDKDNVSSWLRKGLQDSEPEVQLFAIKYIEKMETNIEQYLPDLLGVLHSSSNEKLRTEILSLLRYRVTPALRDSLLVSQNVYKRQSSN